MRTGGLKDFSTDFVKVEIYLAQLVIRSCILGLKASQIRAVSMDSVGVSGVFIDFEIRVSLLIVENILSFHLFYSSMSNNFTFI